MSWTTAERLLSVVTQEKKASCLLIRDWSSRSLAINRFISLVCVFHVRLFFFLFAANLKRNQLRNELNEVEGQHDSTNTENVALKRDKFLLTDEVADLNAKVRVI